MGQTISIIGLGWLGAPLANAFLEKGYRVKGSVTVAGKQRNFAQSDIETYVLQLDQHSIEVSDADFFDTDILYINFPPRRIDGIETIYPGQVKQLLPFIRQYKIEKVIFISSTSVYPEVNRTVSESEKETPGKGSGIACLAAENVLRNQTDFHTTVIRFGGLIGADRNPYRFMQRGIKNGAGLKPVNLIHQDDCIGIINHIIENRVWGEVINGCSPEHPTRKDFYQLSAEIAGAEIPRFDDDATFQFKIVNSEKLVTKLGYQFKYASPIDYLKSLKNDR